MHCRKGFLLAGLLLAGLAKVCSIQAQDLQPTATVASFTKVTETPLTAGQHQSFGCGWIDYDNDGDLDILVANIDAPNALFRNEKGTFVQVKHETFSAVQASFGCTWGDYDNDGWQDVFIPTFGGASHLYHNNGDSTFTRITEGPIVEDHHTAQGSAWADYDNDGDLDLFVANKEAPDALYQNDGAGSFTRVTDNALVARVADTHGVAWADYDNDGDLDLFLATNGGRSNILYRNEGTGTFETLDQSVVAQDGTVSIGGSWGDYDNDGDLDLFVTNSLGASNALYRNDDGIFVAQPESVVAQDSSNSMGSCWGDYDNDGDLDLFVANSDEHPNFLYANIGNGAFRRITRSSIATNTGSSRSCSWGDYDNDGDLDLFVTQAFGADDTNILYRNDNPSQHWLSIDLIGATSNRSAIGAGVYVRATMHGQPVPQTRIVSSQTGAYGHNSHRLHLGLGDAVRLDSLTVVWPSGAVTQRTHLDADQRLTLREPMTSGSTRSPDANLPLPQRSEELHVVSMDGTTLAGTLYLPEGLGPFPTIVFTHGSERGSRKNRGYMQWARIARDRGFAGLIFDKRGVGDSEGTYVEAPDLQVPAQDVLAWVDLLKARSDLQADAIGVLGWSQGGWTGPLAASQSPDLAFVVSISGPGVSPLEQNIYDKTNRLRGRGLSRSQMKQGEHAIREVMTYMVTGQGRKSAEAAWASVQNATWFTENYTGIPFMDHERLCQSKRGQTFIAHNRYNPLPTLERLRIPMLAVFGKADRIVPVKASLRAMENAFQRSGNPNFTSKVFRGADHGIRVRGSDGRMQFARGYQDFVFDWIQATTQR